MTDFYSELRLGLLKATDLEGNRGTFDPLVKVTTLAPPLARQLDTRGGELPSTSVEPGGSAQVAAYATSLHETVHWWQMIGSTTGLLSGLTTAAQATVCAPHLAGVGSAVTKPILQQLKAQPHCVSPSHPAWKAASRWRDLEIAYCLLVDPLHSRFALQSNPFLFESTGYALAQHAAATTCLIQKLAGGAVAPVRKDWERFILEAQRLEASGFEVDSVPKIRIGAKHLFEGQARLIELQYRVSAVERRSLPELEQQGWLDADYGEALFVFLEHTNSPLPDDARDPLINLFLLLCDIAINPSRGYPYPVGSPCNWVSCTHPGLRFESLCNAATKNLSALLEVLQKVSLRSYRDATALLLGDSGWLAADVVAREASTRLAGNDLWVSLPAAEDVAAHLTLAAHQSFTETKAEIPHFFCWPAPFLTGEPDEDLSPYQSLLELYSPPFHTGPSGTGVDTAHLPELDTGSAGKVANKYFRTVAVYELVRQWISQTGPFKFDYSWKPSLRADEIENLKRTFEQSVGVRLEDLTVAK